MIDAGLLRLLTRPAPILLLRKNSREDDNKSGEKWGASVMTDRLFESVYQELRRSAQYYMANEARVLTLQPTALVNEAYIKLKKSKEMEIRSRTHFVDIAKRAMRQVLVDYARRHDAGKRKGSFVDITLSSLGQTHTHPPEDFIALYQALDRLAEDPSEGERKAQLVESVWLLGMDFEEAAKELDVSLRTARRDWKYARAWLHRELSA